MTLNKIYNENCEATLQRMIEDGQKVDLILTSPPYNNSRIRKTERCRDRHISRYDIHLDNMENSEYTDWIVKLFNLFDQVLEKNGVVLWEVSYGNDGDANNLTANLMWLTVAAIIERTGFSVADRIVWKKQSALPNNTSPNKLTRIVEDVFIFCRDDEIKTFHCNKIVTKTSSRGQKYYSPIYNFIEAPNNDGPCNLNKATYSSELCRKLLDMYAPAGGIVYDPFMGTGTTAVACVQRELLYIGSELSGRQALYATNRIDAAATAAKKQQLSFTI
jgi:site-specific DNA-methyltransferase (adenine-specific)/modification methylase